MRLAELVEDYERRRAEAARVGASAPLAKVYGVLLDELRQIDGEARPGRRLTTAEAGEILGVSPKTVRRWIRENRFPATRTSEGDGGEWRIPAEAVYQEAGSQRSGTRSVPRLWSPGDA